MSSWNPEKTLATFFAEVDGIVGAEKTYHALFCHHLLKAGMQPARVGREVRLAGSNAVDVVLMSPQAQGDFSCSEQAEWAIEFKGGAYGDRNALRDEVRPGRAIKDIDKLQALPVDGLSRCFICIDLPELGRAITASQLQTVAEQATSVGIHFAYYCAGEDQGYWAVPGQGLKTIALKRAPSPAVAISDLGKSFSPTAPMGRKLITAMQGLKGSEDVLVTQIYHQLRGLGIGARQLSLETYFNFAAGRNRMQYRPDLSVFDAGVDGHFNLYRQGDRKQSNDAHKLAHLKALIEVKGSAGTARSGDATTIKRFQSDLDKLLMWRERAAAAGAALGVSPVFEAIFIGGDLRPRQLSEDALADLLGLAKAHDVTFHYLPLGA